MILHKKVETECELDVLDGDTIITFYYAPTWLGQKLGRKKFFLSYIGNCTVWHAWYGDSSGIRCGSFSEGRLCNIWQSEKYRQALSKSKSKTGGE